MIRVIIQGDTVVVVLCTEKSINWALYALELSSVEVQLLVDWAEMLDILPDNFNKLDDLLQRKPNERDSLAKPLIEESISTPFSVLQPCISRIPATKLSRTHNCSCVKADGILLEPSWLIIDNARSWKSLDE